MASSMPSGVDIGSRTVLRSVLTTLEQSWFHHLWPQGRGYTRLVEASREVEIAWVMLSASSSSWEGEGQGGRVEVIPSTCLFSPCNVSWNNLSLWVDQRNGGVSRGRLFMLHWMVVRMGSWSARGGRSAATSEDIPRLSRALLAQDRSIMFCPRVGESGGSVRVRSWDSAQARKGSALREG